MDKQTFVEFIKEYKTFEWAVRRLEKALGGPELYNRVELFETDWYQAVDKMFSIFIDSNFTESGADTIYNAIFNPINEFDIENIEEIWNELISDKELYFK